MMTDPIADMLTRIRNARLVLRETVDVPASKLKVAIAKILEEEGYIKSFARIQTEKPQDIIRICLKYSSKGESTIHEIRRVSLPSRRHYLKASDIEKTCGGLGVSIVSTSKGVMTGEQAKKQNLGGEFVCEVW